MITRFHAFRVSHLSRSIEREYLDYLMAFKRIIAFTVAVAHIRDGYEPENFSFEDEDIDAEYLDIVSEVRGFTEIDEDQVFIDDEELKQYISRLFNDLERSILFDVSLSEKDIVKLCVRPFTRSYANISFTDEFELVIRTNSFAIKGDDAYENRIAPLGLAYA